MESIKTTGYFHVALMQNLGGFSVASEMHGRLLQSGLYDATDVINIVILGDKNQADFFIDYVVNKHAKYKLRFHNHDISLFEWPTLSCIYEDCKVSNNDVWYVHTKGTSNCRLDVPLRIQRNIRSWRGVMCHQVIGRHQFCKDLLNKGVDATGAFYQKGVNCFSGNFWWSKASHIRTLKEPKGTRNEAELWICSNTQAKYESLCEMPVFDLYDFENFCGDEGSLKNIQGSI